MKIIPAQATHAGLLTELTMRSKAHWGYSQAQMESWREDLTISEKYIKDHAVFLLESDQKVPGYYSFFSLPDGLVKLDNLFVDPIYMGKGFGRHLMSDFIQRAKVLGFQQVTLDADPHAESFYQKYGFTVVSQLESSVPGRYLPVMVMDL